MYVWIRIFWRFLLLPMVQVVVLSIVQIAGFMVSAQMAGQLSKPETKRTDQSVVTESLESKSSSLEANANADDQIFIENESASIRSTKTNGTDRTLQDKQLRMFGFLVLACLFNSMVLVFWLQTTTLYGWRLAVSTFLVFFMCMTVMPQLDTWLFIRDSAQIIRIAASMGFFVSAFVALFTLPLFWRWRKTETGPPKYLLTAYSKTGIAVRFLISVFSYVVLYLVFGYFLAWQDPEVRSLYGGGEEILGFWVHISTPPTSNLIIPFQVFRGSVWTILCMAMLRVSNGSRVRVAVSISLFIAVVMNSQLLLPNPIMSENIRRIHLIETAIGTFLFGLVCVWLWTSQKSVPTSSVDVVPVSIHAELDSSRDSTGFTFLA